MSKKYVLVIDELFEFEPFYHAPRVFNSKEQAKAEFKKLYERVMKENDDNGLSDWTTDYDEDGMCFSTYPEGWWGTSHYDAHVAEVVEDDEPDYKQRFVALLNEMYADKRAGLIPCMIAEGLKECDAYCKEQPNIDYYVMEAISKK